MKHSSIVLKLMQFYVKQYFEKLKLSKVAILSFISNEVKQQEQNLEHQSQWGPKEEGLHKRKSLYKVSAYKNKITKPKTSTKYLQTQTLSYKWPFALNSHTCNHCTITVGHLAITVISGAICAYHSFCGLLLTLFQIYTIIK